MRRALFGALLTIALADAVWQAAPSTAAPGDLLDAQLVSVAVDGAPYTATSAPVSVAADHVFTVTIVMENTGTATWGSDRGRGQHGATLLTRNPDYNSTFGTRLITVGGVAPGDQATYFSGLRAPSTPGDYTLTWQPADWTTSDAAYQGVSYAASPFFGDTVTLHVTVTAPTPPPVVPAVPASTVSVNDFEYQGSFALPPVPGAEYGDDKHYTESGITLRTVGGETRLIALTGTYHQSVYEVAVPTLGTIAGADTSAVPTATLRTYFGGLPVTDGVVNGTIWYDPSSDLLYWTNHAEGYGGPWGTPPAGAPVLWAANLASGALSHVQQWNDPVGTGVTLGTFAGGVTAIPADFAAAYTGGRALALGSGGMFGPNLAAVSKPSSGGDLSFTPIMYSTGDNRTVRDGDYITAYSVEPQPTDPWTGVWTHNSGMSQTGVFIDLPDKKGYVTFAHLATGRIAGDGYDRGGENVWYAYDYVTLGAAAAGGDANLAPAPSSYATVALPGDGTQEQEYITGAAFDPTARLLYVYARNGVGHGGQPVVHVYKVRQSAPTGVSGVPTTATAGVPLTLTASIAGGSGQTISWSVANAGTTGATVAGSTLKTTAAGTAAVRATVHNGVTGAVDYTQDFTITVNPASSGAKQITRFSVNGVNGVIDQTKHEIIVTLPPGSANTGGLKPDITFTGASVTPASGATQDFTGPWNSSGVVNYLVTAQDGTTQLYRVVVGFDDVRVYAPLGGPYTGEGQNTVQPGTTGTMSFSAMNFGLAPADDLALVLTLPAGITPADLTVSSAGVPSTFDLATGWWRIPHLAGATIHDNELSGGGARLDIQFKVPAASKTGAHYVFTGQLVNVDGQPLVPGDVGYGVTRADFLVVAPDKAWPLPLIDTTQWNGPGGLTHQYDAVLRTFGTAAMTGVTAAVPVPDGCTLVSATPTAGTYDPATGLWTIDSFTLVGYITNSPRLTMVVRSADPPPTTTALSLQVTRIYGVAPDPALGTVVYVGLAENPALRLTAQADTPTAAPGDTVVHTLTLGTNTPDGVYGAKVTVTLPTHATLVSAVSPSGGSFDQASGVWTAAPIGSGVTSTLTLTYTVDAGARNATPITTAAIAAAIPTLGLPDPASALVTTTVVAPVQAQTLTFASPSLTTAVGDPPFTNPLTHVGEGPVTYTSSDAGVASVDPTTGEVTARVAGTTTITANAAEVPGVWEAASASYDVVVQAASPSVAPSSSPSVAPPTSPSVAPPSSPSVAPPSSESVTPPTSPSVAPTSSPTVAPPTTESVAPPTGPSVAPPTTASVAPPTSESVASPTTASVVPPTSPSVAPPTTPSVVPPTSPSVAPPTSPSVAPPTTSSVAPPTSPSVAPPASPSATPTSKPGVKPLCPAGGIHLTPGAPAGLWSTIVTLVLKAVFGVVLWLWRLWCRV